MVVLEGQGPHYCRGVDFKDLLSQGIVVNHPKERYFLPTFVPIICDIIPTVGGQGGVSKMCFLQL